MKKGRRTFVARRSTCGECGKLVPSDSGLACKVVVTTGDGRTLLGRLRRQAAEGRARGRTLAVPQVFCTSGCAVVALRRQLEVLRHLIWVADY